MAQTGLINYKGQWNLSNWSSYHPIGYSIHNCFTCTQSKVHGSIHCTSGQPAIDIIHTSVTGHSASSPPRETVTRVRCSAGATVASKTTNSYKRKASTSNLFLLLIIQHTVASGVVDISWAANWSDNISHSCIITPSVSSAVRSTDCKIIIIKHLMAAYSCVTYRPHLLVFHQMPQVTV